MITASNFQFIFLTKVKSMMKKSLIWVLFMFLPVFFLTGCQQLYQGHSPSGEQDSQKASIKEDQDFSTAYYYLESRIHFKNQEYGLAMASLEKAREKDPGSFILTRDLVKLHLRQNNEEKALALAEELVQTSPDNVNGLLLLVQLKKDAIEEKELVEILTRILDLDPENKETFLRLGRIYIESKKDTEAEKLFEKMVDRFPDYYVAWFYLGQVYMNEKKYELAQKQFLKTIDLEPDLVEPRFQLIKIYEDSKKLSDRKKILAVYTDILKIEPENHRALLGTALHYYKTNRKKEAAKRFNELGQDIESNSRLVMVAFDEYISQKKHEDAVIVFSQMLKADPENSTLNFFTGMAYEAVEKYRKAISHYLKIGPEHTQYKKTILSIAFLYKELGEEKTAINFLENKYKLFPKDIDIITYLASFYERDNRFKSAIEILEKGLSDTPDNTSLMFKLGAVQDKAGLKEKSLETMKKIIEIDPKDASALNYLGYTYTDMGIKLDEALDLIQKAHDLRPDDGYITDSLGWVHFKRGDFSKAVEYLEKAAELTSYESIISDHLGDAYYKQEMFKKALETYEKSVSNATDDDKELVVKVKKKIEALKKQLDE